MSGQSGRTPSADTKPSVDTKQFAQLALNRLLELPRYATSGNAAMKPGLDRIRALFAAMGSPERTFDTVLVAGTNGKGSTAAMIASVLGATGMRVGLHTSPHLVRVNERMRVDGREAPTTWLAATAERYWPVFEKVGASFFEATLALSVLYFAEQDVDAAVVEVGLGGRLDATNALPAVVSVIVHIGFDHMDILGGTLDAIATEKAGIARRGQPLIVGPLAPEAMAAVHRVAERAGASVVVATASHARPDPEIRPGTANLPVFLPDSCRLPLPGRHMRDNARTALAACRALLGSLPEERVVRRALEETTSRTGLRGRLETLRASPLIMVDVGHNADAVAAALETFKPPANYTGSDAPAGSPVTILVLGMLRDKDAEAVGQLLASAQRDHWPTIWTVGVGMAHAKDAGADTRTQSGQSLASRLESAGCLVAEHFPSATDALTRLLDQGNHAPGALFMGSHHVAADIIQRLQS